MRTSPEFRRRLAEGTAAPMFWLSLLFLATVAALIVLWLDVPRVRHLARAGAEGPPRGTAVGALDRALPEEEAVWEQPAGALGCVCLYFLCALWPFFILEFLVQNLLRDPELGSWRQRCAAVAICLCPPLRLCARNRDMEGKIWLPRLGWQPVRTELRDRLERTFSVPMIFIALLILPVLLVEFALQEQVAEYFWLRTLLHVGTGLIWFAFAVEFIVMVSVAEKKWRYCRQHWIDLAIILLPLLSFLRSLRIIRVTRVARLARVQQLAKMTRLYRLRGLTIKGFRALTLLEVMNRLLPANPEKTLRQLKDQLQEKEAEIASLRSKIARVEKEIARRKSKKEADKETTIAQTDRLPAP